MESRYHSSITTPFRRDGYRRGFTVLELLVVVTTIGLIIAMLLPAVMGTRESARQTICTNHLREVGIAVHHHHDRHRRLPSAWTPVATDPDFAYGWASKLLPEIEQPGLYGALLTAHRPANLNDLVNAEHFSMPLLLCPSDIAEKAFALMEDSYHARSHSPETTHFGPRESTALICLPATNYVGVYGTVEADDYQEYQGPNGGSFGDGCLIDHRRVTFADLQRGLSQTLLVGERMMATVPSTWLGIDLRGEDAPCRVAGSAITSPNCETCDECEFSSRHRGGCNFLWADGHVTMINDSIDRDMYRQLARRFSQ